MKKGLLSLLAVALTIVSCQNYDDQFAELTDLVNTLSTDVEGLTQVQTDLASVKATVNGLVTAISGIPTTDNSTALTDVLAKLVLAQADIDAIELILAGGVASADDLAAIDTLIDAVQDGVNTLLTKNAAITVNIIINDTDTLATAAEYIEIGELSPAGYLLSGTLTVDHTNLTAAQITEANILTAKIISVSSAVTVNGAVDLSGLSYIGGAYSIEGAVAPLDDTISSLGGALNVDGKQGVISFPNLTSIVGNVVVTSLVASVTSIDLSSVTVSGGTFQGGVSTPFAALETADFGPYAMTAVNNPIATSITLGQTSNAAGLDITAPKATAININALTSSAGVLKVTSAASTAVIHLDALVSAVGGIDADQMIVAEFHLPALTEIKTAAHNIQAKVIDLSALKKITFAATFTDTENLITTDVFVAASATMAFTTCNIAHLNFPKLVLTSTITANSSTTQVTVASSGDADLTNILTGVPTAVKVNLTAQTVTIAGATAMNAVTTLNVVGKISAASVINLTLNGTAGQTDALTELTVADLGAVVLGGTAATSVVTVTTAGAIDDLTLDTNVALVSVTIGHGPHSYTGFPAQAVTITDNLNAGFKSVDLGSVVLLDEATITGNASLATITAPDTTGTLLSNAVVSLTIDSNSLVATSTAAVAGTNLANITQPSLTTWKAYTNHVKTTIGATDAQLDAGVPIAIAFDYDKDAAGVTNNFDTATAGFVAGTGVINLTAELAHIDANN